MTKKNSKDSTTSSLSKKTRSAKPERERKRSARIAMGLDLSLRGTGLVVVRGADVLRSRRLATEPIPDGAVGKGGSSGLRVQAKSGSKVYRGDIEECIEYVARRVITSYKKFSPDIVVLENYAFSAHSRALSSLHEVGGVVKNYLHRIEAPWVVVTPNEVKKLATGNGNANKAEMLIASRRAGHDFRNSDEADAYWCAQWGLENYDRLFD